MVIDHNNAKEFGIFSKLYKASGLFKNHHVNTMYPYLFRGGLPPQYTRERWATDDGDFFDIDWIKKESDSVLVILHGLEGSSNSQYVKGLATAMADKHIDIAAVNHRSCSGEMNKTMGFYHSGFTKDLRFIVQKLSDHYQKIYLAGFSLGGNIAMKYAGEEADKINPKVKSVAAVSVPCHLASSAIRLNAWYNRPYAIQFLMTLKKKALEKSALFNHRLPYTDQYTKINTLLEYDHKITAPLHGFEDAFDYYAKSSSLPLLDHIRVPTLLINASDDSFLAKECMPFEIANQHPYFHFLQTRYGGHVGFANLKYRYWIDDVLREWMDHQE